MINMRLVATIFSSTTIITGTSSTVTIAIATTTPFGV